MKLTRLLIAAVALAGLSAAVWWSNKKEKADAAKPPADASPKVLALKKDDIRQIEIKRRDGDATTVKKGDSGKWDITAPKPERADQSAIDSVTGLLSDLSSDRVIDDKVADADLASYGLAPPYLQIDVAMKDGKMPKLLIGEETPTGNDVYAKVEGDPRLFTTATANKTGLDKTGKDLRDKSLMTFDQDKVSRVELTAKKQTIEFGRVNQNDWQILKPKPLRADGLQVEELVRKLKDATMDTSVSDEDAKKFPTTYASAQVIGVAKVTDPGGTQTLEVRKAKDDYYAKSSVVDGIQKVTKDLADGLDKSLGDFENKKLFDFGFSDPTRIEFKDGGKSATYEKSGEKWLSNGKTMDSVGVQSFIDKLRDLSASKFVDSGFTTPAVELTVVSNDGKRTEKVQISPASGGDFIARREGEPALYGLDAKTVQDLRQAAGDIREQAPPEKKK